MIRAFTTVEQGKILVEKGLDPRTSDAVYIGASMDSLFMNLRGFKCYDPRRISEYDPLVPCWSMARLLALLPDKIVIDRERKGRKNFMLSIEKFEPWYYNVAYSRTNYLTQEIEVLMESSCLDSPLDSLVEVLGWVLENKYDVGDIHKEIIEEE